MTAGTRTFLSGAGCRVGRCLPTAFWAFRPRFSLGLRLGCVLGPSASLLGPLGAFRRSWVPPGPSPLVCSSVLPCGLGIQVWVSSFGPGLALAGLPRPAPFCALFSVVWGWVCRVFAFLGFGRVFLGGLIWQGPQKRCDDTSPARSYVRCCLNFQLRLHTGKGLLR